MQKALKSVEAAYTETVKRIIANCFAGGELRPVVSITLRIPDRLYFVATQSNPERNISTPQGGLYLLETPIEAAYRELREEVGLSASAVELVSPLNNWEDPTMIPFDPKRIERGGFTKGEVYFCLGATLKSGGFISLLPDATGYQELSEPRLVNAEEAIRLVIEQPGNPNITEATRQKGRLVIAPAIRAMEAL